MHTQSTKIWAKCCSYFVFLFYLFFGCLTSYHTVCVCMGRASNTLGMIPLFFFGRMLSRRGERIVHGVWKNQPKKEKAIPWLGIQFAYAIQFNCRTLIESMNTLNSLWCVFHAANTTFWSNYWLFRNYLFKQKLRQTQYRPAIIVSKNWMNAILVPTGLRIDGWLY